MTDITQHIVPDNFPISINDIRDRYFDGDKLTSEEFDALQNYDRYRLKHLSEATTDKEFDKRYMELQAKANLASFNEFLDWNNLK